MCSVSNVKLFYFNKIASLRSSSPDVAEPSTLTGSRISQWGLRDLGIIYAGAHIFICMHVVARRLCQVSSLIALHLMFCSRFSLTEPGAQIHLGSLVSELQRRACLYFFSTTGAAIFLGLFCSALMAALILPPVSIVVSFCFRCTLKTLGVILGNSSALV